MFLKGTGVHDCYNFMFTTASALQLGQLRNSHFTVITVTAVTKLLLDRETCTMSILNEL
jgi:hypothetical protein